MDEVGIYRSVYAEFKSLCAQVGSRLLFLLFAEIMA